MRCFRVRRYINFIIILSILVCGICFDETPFKTYSSAASCATSGAGLSSDVRINVEKEQRNITQEIMASRGMTNQMIRHASRRMPDVIAKRAVIDLSFVDLLPQEFHLHTVVCRGDIADGDSGHLQMLRCVYQEDGKK